MPKTHKEANRGQVGLVLKNINNDFHNFIFIDETKIMINQCKLYHLRKKSSYPDCIILDNYFKAKLNVWGGISKQGPVDFVVSKFLFEVTSIITFSSHMSDITI